MTKQNWLGCLLHHKQSIISWSMRIYITTIKMINSIMKTMGRSQHHVWI